jgi:hypothetical protein
LPLCGRSCFQTPNSDPFLQGSCLIQGGGGRFAAVVPPSCPKEETHYLLQLLEFKLSGRFAAEVDPSFLIIILAVSVVSIPYLVNKNGWMKKIEKHYHSTLS